MKLKESKSEKIQFLRGISIFAVVCVHCIPEGSIQIYCRPFINFCVAMFLFLSGLLSKIEKWNPKKRIYKVLIPYSIWTLIYVILINYDNMRNIPVEFFKKLILGNAVSPLYFILVYCQFTLLIPIIDKLAKSRYKYWGFIVTPLEILFMRLIPLIINYEFNFIIKSIMSISCLGWFTFFYLGYLLGNDIIKININTKKLLVYLIISIVLQMMEGYYYLYKNYTNCGTQLKFSAVLTNVLIVIWAFNFINLDVRVNKDYFKIIKLLGDNSFGIYFLHMAILKVLNKIPYYADYIFFPVNAIITLIITIICVLIGKKILGKYSKYLAL